MDYVIMLKNGTMITYSYELRAYIVRTIDGKLSIVSNAGFFVSIPCN